VAEPALIAAPAFPQRVALHASCHALRELRLGSPSETREPPRLDPARELLKRVPGLELVALTRPDECCGFGGVFAVEEEAVSCRMALDRLADHAAARAEVVTSTDVSCLLHLEGVARRRGFPLRLLHVAEIVAGRTGMRAASR
jgi:L-lactate dehydrogenase complex protein LldE